MLTKLTGFKLTRGMLCAMYRPKLPAPYDICLRAEKIAVLENVMNPTNLGAIFRSAAALGIDGILLTDGCTDPLYRRAIRVSMGNVLSHTVDVFGQRRVAERRYSISASTGL